MKKIGSMVYVIAALAAASFLLVNCDGDNDKSGGNPCLDLQDEYAEQILCVQCVDWSDFCDCVEGDGYYDCTQLICIFNCDDATPGYKEECACNIEGLEYNEGTGECEEPDPDCDEGVMEFLQGLIDSETCIEFDQCD